MDAGRGRISQTRRGNRGTVGREKPALPAAGDIEHRALEAGALDVFRQRHLSRSELRQLLGFATRGTLDEFLTAHGIFGTYTPEDLERDRRDLAQLGF